MNFRKNNFEKTQLGKCKVLFCLLAVLLVPVVVWAKSAPVQHYEIALGKRALGDIDGAAIEFRAAIEASKTTSAKANLLSLLAEMFDSEKRNDDAATAYQDLLDLQDPSFISVGLYGLAKIHYRNGNLLEADEYCRKLAVNFPKCPMIEFADYMERTSPNSVDAKVSREIARFKKVNSEAENDRSVTTKRPIETIQIEKTSPSEPVSGIIDTIPASEIGEKRVETENEVRPKMPESRWSFETEGWWSRLGGTLSARGMNLDFGGDLDFSQNARVFLSAAYYLTAKDRLSVSYHASERSGSLGRNVTYGGKSYTTAASINQDSDTLDFGGYRNVARSDSEEWGILYGVSSTYSRFRMNQPLVGGQRVGTVDHEYVSPYLGFEIKSRINPGLWISGMAKFFPRSGSDTGSGLTDAAIHFLFGRDHRGELTRSEWHGTIGLRYFRADGGDSNESGEIKYFGPTIGIVGEF